MRKGEHGHGVHRLWIDVLYWRSWGRLINKSINRCHPCTSVHLNVCVCVSDVVYLDEVEHEADHHEGQGRELAGALGHQSDGVQAGAVFGKKRSV